MIWTPTNPWRHLSDPVSPTSWHRYFTRSGVPSLEPVSTMQISSAAGATERSARSMTEAAFSTSMWTDSFIEGIQVVRMIEPQ